MERPFKIMLLKSFVCGFLCTLSLTSSADTPLSLENGDRVVFLGNAFFERARYYGHIETELSLRWPNAHVTFRNIGWSGDTVGGLARTGGRRGSKFGTEEEGFEVLVDHVASLNPTHLFIAYGFNESFSGRAGLDAFSTQLDLLLKAVATKDREVILLSPLPVEHGFGAPAAYVDERNKMIGAYAEIIQEKARTGNHRFVDLFRAMHEEKDSFSEDGIHPTSEGYARIAEVLVRTLDVPQSSSTMSAQERERLREAIVKKNALYFHRWRPRNDAFVYGERKDEQPIANSEPQQIESFINEQQELIWELLNRSGAKSSREQ